MDLSCIVQRPTQAAASDLERVKRVRPAHVEDFPVAELAACTGLDEVNQLVVSFVFQLLYFNGT